jgi:hypothetical protein
MPKFKVGDVIYQSDIIPKIGRRITKVGDTKYDFVWDIDNRQPEWMNQYNDIDFIDGSFHIDYVGIWNKELKEIIDE